MVRRVRGADVELDGVVFWPWRALCAVVERLAIYCRGDACVAPARGATKLSLPRLLPGISARGGKGSCGAANSPASECAPTRAGCSIHTRARTAPCRSGTPAAARRTPRLGMEGHPRTRVAARRRAGTAARTHVSHTSAHGDSRSTSSGRACVAAVQSRQRGIAERSQHAGNCRAAASTARAVPRAPRRFSSKSMMTTSPR